MYFVSNSGLLSKSFEKCLQCHAQICLLLFQVQSHNPYTQSKSYRHQHHQIQHYNYIKSKCNIASIHISKDHKCDIFSILLCLTLQLYSHYVYSHVCSGIQKYPQPHARQTCKMSFCSGEMHRGVNSWLRHLFWTIILPP